jgi:ubiquinone/menaquinone biosynthesis C-methylase UbiE
MTGFESIDLWYETPLGRLYFTRIKEKLDELINTREERAYALDAGCGAGHYSLNLARSYKVIGVDKSQVLVSKALEKSDRLGIGVNFLAADIVSLPFPSNFFKLIICLNVIEFVPGGAKAVEEMKRVLAPGGVLVLGVCNKKSLWGLLKGIGKPFRKSDPFFAGSFYSKDDLLSLARQTGFKVDEIKGAIYFPPIKNASLAILCEKVGRRFLKGFPGCLIASMKKSEDVKSI